MKNVDVISAFVNGATKGKTKNLFIDGNKLFNYDTCLAEIKDDGNAVINMTKYSQSTSTIQNKLLDTMQFQFGSYFEIVRNIKMGADSL